MQSSEVVTLIFVQARFTGSQVPGMAPAPFNISSIDLIRNETVRIERVRIDSASMYIPSQHGLLRLMVASVGFSVAHVVHLSTPIALAGPLFSGSRNREGCLRACSAHVSDKELCY